MRKLIFGIAAYQVMWWGMYFYKLITYPVSELLLILSSGIAMIAISIIVGEWSAID